MQGLVLQLLYQSLFTANSMSSLLCYLKVRAWRQGGNKFKILLAGQLTANFINDIYSLTCRNLIEEKGGNNKLININNY